MFRLSLFRSLIAATSLFFYFIVTQAQDNPSLVIFKSESGQGSFTLRKEFHPAIAEIGLQVFTPEVKMIHQQRGPANQPLIWRIKDASGKLAQDQIYLCAIELKPLSGASYFMVGRIMQPGNEREFSLLEERPNNLPGPKPEEFHQSLTQAMPDNGAAWFFYGLAICDRHRDSYGIPAISTSPPPPPPQAAPPPPGWKAPKEFLATKEELKQIAEEDRLWKAKNAALQKDLKIAQPAFLKAAESADDCQIKDAAMSYLAAIASEFDNQEQNRQWLLKRIESPCATKDSRAESYYALGVKQWSCAYEITGKYQNQNRRATDPFHFRAITNRADKQQFDNCLTTGSAYLEKALEADPNYVDAMYYKALIYREKQKVTANPAERKKIGDEAMKISNRASELMNQRNK